MLKSKKFISMPIVSLEEGQQIGTVRGIIVNPFKRELAALIIDQKGWFKDQKIIPYTKVRSVGDHAITVEKSNSVEKATNLPEILKLIKENYELAGAKVVTENGSALGYVDEFLVDPSNGQITSIEVSGKFLNSFFKGKASLSMEFTRTIGKEVVIVQEQALDELVKVDGGIQETLLNIKDSTSQLWETTVQKTKELGKNLKKEIDEEFKKDSNEQTDIEGEPVYQGKFSTPTVLETPDILVKPQIPPVENDLFADDDLFASEEIPPENKE